MFFRPVDERSNDGSAPKVTIITPVFNRVALLAETIESILAQGWRDFEYLIVDDGSTEPVEACVRGYADPRIIYLHQENAGEAVATNHGWARARGEYVAVVSSDDPVLPDWLETAVHWLDERPEAIVAYPDWQLIDETGTAVRDIQTFDYRLEHMVGWFHTFPGPGALIRRSAFAPGIPLRTPGYRFAPDLDSWLRLGLCGPFTRIPTTLATWRAHPDSISVAERSLARASELVALARNFFARDDLPDSVRALERRALSRAWYSAAWVIKDAHPFRSALYLRRSYRIQRDDPPGLPPSIRRAPRPDTVQLMSAAWHGLRLTARRVGDRPRVETMSGLPAVAVRAMVAGVKGLRSLAFGPVLYLLLKRRAGFFDTVFYHTTYPPGPFARAFPCIAFAFDGAWRLYDPNPHYSQRAVMVAEPAMRLLPPVFSDLLPWAPPRPPAVREASEEAPVPESPEPEKAERDIPLVVATEPTPEPQSETIVVDAPPDRYQALWPVLARDMQGFSRVASSLTPTANVRDWLGQRRRFAVDQPAGAAVRALLAAFPERVDHLVLVPWLGVSGGSEKVSQRLIAALRAYYGDKRICVFGTDANFDLPPEGRTGYGVPIVAINDALPEADPATRTLILDRVLIELRPRTVHNVNSLAGWVAFSERAAQYAQDMNLFVNLYSDIRIDDDIPVGFYWNYLPYIAEHLTGVFADNRCVIAKAAADFGLPAEVMARFHYVPTPIVGLDGRAAKDDLRSFTPGERPHALWMSRIAFEKRLDVLEAMAKACPDRTFVIYGAILPGARVVDMSWTRRPNVDYRGTFGSFADLPLEEFDAYVFTTSAEGMPLAVMEAAMLGLPIVAPDVGGIGEFIDDETGWLVSRQDAVDEYVAALETIRRNPDEARKRVQAVQARLLERHSWEGFQRTLRDIPGYLHEVGA